MLNNEYNVRLNNLLNDIMVQFPLMARKIALSSKMKALPVSSVIQSRVLDGLMAGPMQPAEISRVNCISKPNVTTLISKLVESGLVQRSHDEKDRRVIFVILTDKGKRVVQRKRNLGKKCMFKMFNQFNADEIEEMFSAIETIKNLLVKLNNYQ